MRAAGRRGAGMPGRAAAGKMGDMSSRERRGRAAVEGQPGLFDERGLVEVNRSTTPAAPRTGAAAADFTKGELIAMLPHATPTNVERLCAAVVSRSLGEAVPALERLWRRFAGFGIGEPLVEQRAVLNTLARLGCGPARAALKRIVLSKGLPASQLPMALRAASDAGLVLPAAFLAPLLRHGEAAVREPAFALAPKAGVPDVALRAGLRDASAPVRRAAAIALGTLGAGAAGGALIAELARDPSRKVIGALAAIGDDEAIVHLGRCAERYPALAGTVIDVLHDMESGRAVRLAARLEAGLGVSGEGGG